MRRFLFIARVFPPQGGGGAQRPAKLVRHLIDCGWTARVIAAPPFGELRDESLAAEIPPEVDVHRLPGGLGARAPEALRALKLARPYASLRRAALLNDDGFLDLAETVALGLRYAADADAIAATSLPFSSIVAGALIARLTRKPFLADLRDPWAFAPRMKAASAAHLSAMRSLERRTLARAEAVVTVTEGCRAHLPPEIAARTLVIPNGYDPGDLEIEPEPRPQGTLRIVHAGTLYGMRRPTVLLEAVERVRASRPDRRIELIMAGATHEHSTELREAGVELRGYLSHRDAVALLRSADVIIGLVGDDPADDHALPAKLFEAAALGPPVLCWARPESESAAFIEKTGAGRVVPTRDAIERALFDLIDGRLKVRPLSQRQPVLAPYHRAAVAARFAEVLDRISAPR